MVENKRAAITSQVILNAVFVVVSLVFIIPLILVISASLTNEQSIKMYGYNLFPRVFDLKAYNYLFQAPDKILDAYAVTFFSSVVGSFLSVIVMGLVAYAISRRDFAYRKIITQIIFITMIVNGGLIPTYLFISQNLKMIDSIWVYILPGLVSAWYVLIMRTFFQSIHVSLIESAKIDGCSELGIFFKIVVPLSKPVVATIALFVMLNRWNEWMATLLYIRNDRLYTLQFLLQRILREASFIKEALMKLPAGMLAAAELPELSLRYAMTVVAAGPMLLVFPFFQKYFTKGLTVGAVKG